MVGKCKFTLFFSNRLDSLTFQLHPRLSGSLFLPPNCYFVLREGPGPHRCRESLFSLIKSIRKVRKTQHQGYSLKYIRAGGGLAKHKKPWITIKFILSSPLLSVFLSASTDGTYKFTTPTCTATIITLEPGALNVSTFHTIPRFNKFSLLYVLPGNKGFEMKPALKTG